MIFALLAHNAATGQITVYELPTVAVIEPRAKSKDDRMWDSHVTVHLNEGPTMTDSDPGHAIMEVLGLFAEDEGVPRWRRAARDMPVPERNETQTVNHPGERVNGRGDQVPVDVEESHAN